MRETPTSAPVLPTSRHPGPRGHVSPVRQVLRRRRITSDTAEAPLRSDPRRPPPPILVVVRHPVGPRAHVRGGARDPSRVAPRVRLLRRPPATSGCGRPGLHDVGIRNFYDYLGGNTTYVYPPGYLYVLDLLGAGVAVAELRAAQAPGDPRRSRSRVGRRRLRGAAGARGSCGDASRCAPLVVAAVLFNPAVFASEHGLGPGRRRCRRRSCSRRCSCC